MDHAEDRTPLPLDEIIREGAELRDLEKGVSIIRSLSAIVSILSSLALVWMLRRSRVGFSTTFHRVLLGMCVGDVLYSLSLAHFNVTSPADDAYFVWNARGSQATCSAQGFLCVLGAAWGMLYNCSLNLLSLAVARYQLTRGQVRVLEPFLHGVPVACALTLSVNLLVRENYNELSGGMCYKPVYEPPHCRGYEDGEVREGFEVPCGRGREGGMSFFYAYAIGIIFFVPLVVGASLWMIHRTVIQQERRIARRRADEMFAAILRLPPLELDEPGGDEETTEEPTDMMAEEPTEEPTDMIAEEQTEEPMAMVCGVPVALPVLDAECTVSVDQGGDPRHTPPGNPDSPDLLLGSPERRGVIRAEEQTEEPMATTWEIPVAQTVPDAECTVSADQGGDPRHTPPGNTDSPDPLPGSLERRGVIGAEGQTEEPMAVTCGDPVDRPVPAGVDPERPECPGSPDLRRSLERRGVIGATHVGDGDLGPPRGHRALKRSRALLYRALAFSFAYFLSFFFLAVGFYFFDIRNLDWPIGLLYAVNIFNPLQGFFNFVVFMLPRVVDAKNRWGDDMTWCQAISSAFWSRGNKQCWLPR